MEEQRRETTVVRDNGVVSSQAVATSKVTTGYKIEQVIWLILGVLEAILALRFVLALLGANQSNGFANFIYTISYPFVAPFFGLFSYHFQAGVSYLEIETLVAMLVYALITWGIVRLVRIMRA